jgi:FkbM family methyltransferase
LWAAEKTFCWERQERAPLERVSGRARSVRPFKPVKPSLPRRVQLLSWIGCRIGKPPGWERVVRRLAPPAVMRGMGEICLVREGIALVVRPAVPIGWHIALFGTYEPELREIFRAVLRRGGIAIDIGANIGWHTLLMADLVGIEGRVLTAEANPSVRRSLQENIDLNRFQQVDIIPYALADAEGTVMFHGPEAHDPDSGNGYVISNGAERCAATISVEARRLDQVVFSAGIDRLDLIKIDVEGFEWPVLKGGEQTIASFRPHIVFEFDAAYAPRGGGSAVLMDDFFRRHRYRLFRIGRNWAHPVGLSSWPDCANVLAIPSG